MPEHHITYIRDSDRTRLIFVMDGDLADCIRRAIVRAPVDFRLAAVKDSVEGRLEIKCDGDDYGG